MRIALISDIHTRENADFILDYLRKKSTEWKIDIIIINGDILGENEAREGYGYNYNKALFLASLDRENILGAVAGELSDKLLKIKQSFEKVEIDENEELEFSDYIKRYVSRRYDYLLTTLAEFSKIARTFYNLGNYESPLHYNVLKELAFLIDVNEQYIRKLALLSDYRETFKVFLKKIKEPAFKRLHYIGGNTFREGDLLIAGIPGLNPSSVPSDKASDFQEKMTAELMSTVTRQMSYASKLLVLNTVQGRLRKEPFSFRPASFSVRNFIESSKGKMKQKLFVQSYHHFMSTHFYIASEFHFILNNAAVNNCLFNLIDIGKKVGCYDIDPKLDKARLLKNYNYNLADYSTARERLSLNYSEPDEIVKERNLEGCYYM